MSHALNHSATEAVYYSKHSPATRQGFLVQPCTRVPSTSSIRLKQVLNNANVDSAASKRYKLYKFENSREHRRMAALLLLLEHLIFQVEKHTIIYLLKGSQDYAGCNFTLLHVCCRIKEDSRRDCSICHCSTSRCGDHISFW